MIPPNKALAGLLAVQMVLVGFTWWPRTEAIVAPAPLLDFAPDDITAIEITGRTSDGESPAPVKLEKLGTHWVISSAGGYPADPEKVRALTVQLTDTQVLAPIATQAASHAALDVSESHNTRHVKIAAGNASAELFYGAASGSTAHVRRADQDEVYTARGYTAWSIGDMANRYYDPIYLQLDLETVDSLTVLNDAGSFTLEKELDGWTAAGVGEGLELSPTEVSVLLNRVLNVRMTEPVGTGDDPSWGLADGVRVEWTTTEGDATTSSGYTIGAADNGQVYLRADGNPFTVKVSQGAVRKALEITLDDLVVEGQPIP